MRAPAPDRVSRPDTDRINEPETVLAQFLIFAPDHILNDCFGLFVPVPRPAAVADADWDRRATADVAFVGPLAERDPLAALANMAAFTEIALRGITWVGHSPHRP